MGWESPTTTGRISSTPWMPAWTSWQTKFARTSTPASRIHARTVTGMQKLITAMGSTLQDKFNEVMRDLARVYDKNNKEHRETRDVIAWIQQQCEYIEHRTDHLPERLTILRDKLDDLGRSVDQVRRPGQPPCHHRRHSSNGCRRRGARGRRSCTSTSRCRWP